MISTAAPAPRPSDHARAEASVGSTVDGRYELRRVIAHGGVGVVFEAQQIFTRRTVAVKLVPTRSIQTRAHAPRERLLREAHALSSVAHPGFVQVLDAGVCAAHGPYVAMEMLDGRPLDGLLASRGRLDLADAAAIGRQLCASMAHAHAHGIVHRDLKPATVFVARAASGAEVVKLIDLGLAELRGPSSVLPDQRLTKSGELLGTPEYMAPERLMGQPGDARADIYSIAAVLFECLTGAPPFTGRFPQVLMKVGAATAAPSLKAARPDVSDAVAAVFARALALSPDKRFADAASFARALDTALGELPRATRLVGDAGVSSRALAPLPAETAAPTVTLVAEAPSPVRRGPPPLPNPAPKERRFMRAPFVTPVRLVDGHGHPLEGRSEDISVGGLLFITSRACAVGHHVEVSLAIPGTGQHATLMAVVRWVGPTRDKTAIGLAFTSLPDDVMRHVQTYVTLITT
jgi:serine/threonine protein kinase